MAPKKKSAVAKRPRVADLERERRSKQRFESVVSRPPVSSTPTQNPAGSPSNSSDSSAHILPLPSLDDRTVTTGRRIDFDFLEGESFRIGHWLKSQGWEFFCSLELPTYTSVVREFYRNLKRGYNSLESSVKGVSIVLTESRLSRIWKMPRVGDAPSHPSNRLEALHAVVDIPVYNDIGDCYANMLSVEIRLLHHILTRIFFPKTGRFDFVSEKELVFMHYLIQGRPLNLPALLMHQIREAPTRAKACLPYGMALTLVFQDFGISLEGEDKKKLSHFDTYGIKSLIRMGYKKVDGRWTKRISGQDDRAAAPSAPSAPPSSPSAPASAAPPSPATPTPTSIGQQSAPPPNLSEDQLKSIATYLGEYLRSHPPSPQTQQPDLSKLESELSSLRAEVAHLSAQISDMKVQSQSHWDIADFKDMAQEAALLRGRIQKAETHITSEFQIQSIRQSDGIKALMASIGHLITQLERLAPIAASAASSSARPPFPRTAHNTHFPDD